MPALTTDGVVSVLTLGAGENRMSLEWLDAVDALLDEVQGRLGRAALVTCAQGKYWCNGLDLDWVDTHPEEAHLLLRRAQQLLARVLLLPMPTIAAVTGHAFAAGAMLAMSHDARVMRADRGWWCLPEVSIALPFTDGMTALLQARLPRSTAHEAMTAGRRYTGPEAMAAGIVEDTASEADLLPAAVKRAAALADTAGPTLGSIKAALYPDASARLRSAAARFLGRPR